MISVAGVIGNEVHGGVFLGIEFGSRFKAMGERGDGFLPRFRTILFADVPDLSEAPEDVLPRGDILWSEFAFTKLCAERVQDWIVVGRRKGCLQEAEVFRT